MYLRISDSKFDGMHLYDALVHVRSPYAEVA